MGETEQETYILQHWIWPSKKKNLQQNLHHAVTSLSIKFKRASILEVKIRL